MMQRRSRSDSGFSLAEAVIGSALVAALLGLTYGSVQSISTMAQSNSRTLESQRTQADLLDRLRSELVLTGRDGRYEIAPDGRSISFQIIEGATLNGAEVAGSWSSMITIALETEGNVIRRQNGRSIVLAREIVDLQFQTPVSGVYITVDCVTRRKGKDVPRRARVYPSN